MTRILFVYLSTWNFYLCDKQRFTNTQIENYAGRFVTSQLLHSIFFWVQQKISIYSFKVVHWYTPLLFFCRRSSPEPGQKCRYPIPLNGRTISICVSDSSTFTFHLFLGVPQRKQAQAVISLGCDFFSLHTNTQIQKRRFSISRNVFTFSTILCVFVLSKKLFFW